jgi:hypothetical protein
MTDQPDERIPVELRVALENALRKLVEHEKLARQPNFQERLDASIDLAVRFHQRHGVWGEEFSTL